MPKVEQHMNRYVLTVTPEQTLEEAAQAMVERQVGSAVVLGHGAVVGIITERDLMLAVARGRVPWNTKVDDCMTREPVVVPPLIGIHEAIKMLFEGGFRHLPVVDEGQLIGIVSLRDLLRAVEGEPIKLDVPAAGTE